MSLALAVINERRVVQLERGMVYEFAAKSYSSADEMRSSGAAAHARLMNAPAPRAVVLTLPAPELPQPRPAIVDYAPLNMLTPCSWRFLVALAAVRHGQDVREILSHTRARPVAAARHEAAYLVAQHTTFSIVRIGRLFGRDHTTILNSLKHFPPLKRERVTQFAASQRFVREPVKGIPEGASRAQAIEVGYSKGISPKDIARAVGSTAGSIKVSACKKRLGRPAPGPKHKLDWGLGL